MALEQEAKEAIELLKQKHSSFPQRCCKFAAREMHSRGCQIVSGSVIVDNYIGIGKVIELYHYWNYDQNSGLYVDITASQFNAHLSEGSLPEIALWRREEIPKCYTIIAEDLSLFQLSAF